jgi:hypothetical protein
MHFIPAQISTTESDLFSGIQSVGGIGCALKRGGADVAISNEEKAAREGGFYSVGVSLISVHDRERIARH